MIPNYIPADAPPGERALFSALAQAPETEAWTVLHSLSIAEHVRQVEGEADFVVIVPGHGILVIEVKSHQHIAVLPDGTWKLGTQAPTARGPVRQADEAMHSLREYLAKKKINLYGTPIACAAWFTHTRARAEVPSSPEWHDWQILDSTDITRGAPAAILKTLQSGTEHLSDVLRIFKNGPTGPDQDQAEKIAMTLRPRFEFGITPGDRRRVRDEELLHFIDEQFHALDAMGENRAVLFTGPAGTGKTLLATEAARRETQQSKTGRLLCFNSFLGRQLQTTFRETNEVIAGTFHAQLLELSGIRHIPGNAGNDFWNGTLVDAALEKLLEWGDDDRSDFLIVDEIQDLTSPGNLDVLDLLVKGGLANGRILMFGDFDRQAIYESADNRSLLRERIPGLTNYGLRINCRNLPRIAHTTETFNVFPGYQGYRRHDDGITPVIVKVDNPSRQDELLSAAIRDLRTEGYELSEITVLSPRKDDSAAASTTDPWLRQILAPADGTQRQNGKVEFATIHAYKGLEATAVILTDLNQDYNTSFEPLLYIGITRATDRLVLLIETRTLRSMLGGAK